ncbi:MAG TPA: BMP family ABC transporter substrate-binding protein [Burkholderiaceae bacterium]
MRAIKHKITLLSVSVSLAAATLFAAPVQAADAFVPAVIYDVGGKFDKSFNQAAYTGAEKFKKETGVKYLEGQINADIEGEQILRHMARKGASIIFVTGFQQQGQVSKIAPQFPKVKFVLVNVAPTTPLPNVLSMMFREEEGSFLAGMAASMASKSGKVGFIGGMDIPLISRFGCGYAQGAQYANPKATIVSNMVGSTAAAFRDPTRGAELAISQFDRGVDVVFAAAGNTGTGVIQAAKDKGKLAIGVDSNQNYVHPGTVLTSMVKQVDNAVYQAFKSAQAGTWKPGVVTLGLKDQGVMLAIDQHNRKLITPQMEAKLNQAKADIIAGKIKVHDYTTNNSCPVKL